MNINMIMNTFNELMDNPELILYAKNIIEVFENDRLASVRVLDVKSKQNVGANFNIEMVCKFLQDNSTDTYEATLSVKFVPSVSEELVFMFDLPYNQKIIITGSDKFNMLFPINGTCKLQFISGV